MSETVKTILNNDSGIIETLSINISTLSLSAIIEIITFKRIQTYIHLISPKNQTNNNILVDSYIDMGTRTQSEFCGLRIHEVYENYRFINFYCTGIKFERSIIIKLRFHTSPVGLVIDIIRV